MSETVQSPARRVRPFAWSVRREIWENRALYMAPLIVAAVTLTAFVVSTFAFSGHALPRHVLRAASDPRAAQSLNMPYAAVAGAVFLISAIVAIFYCLGALHGERRDRSVLFWKSLPVSDATTVLAKAAIPLAVQPVIILAVVVASQLLMLGWSMILLALNGIGPEQLWAHLSLPFFWGMLLYGLVVNALWAVPVFGWLLLVSAWARRMTFVWAVAPPLGLALFEFLAFRSRHVIQLLERRIFGGYAEAYTVGGKGQAAIANFGQADPLRFLANPGLWGGLVFGAACLAACVWLRRRAEPI